MSEFEPTPLEAKILKHGLLIGIPIFIGNVWLPALAFPVIFYLSRGLQKFIPMYLEKRRKRKELEAQRAPVIAELKRQADQEREVIVEDAQKRMKQRIQLAQFITDPLIREQEVASANRDFAKTLRAVNEK